MTGSQSRLGDGSVILREIVTLQPFYQTQAYGILSCTSSLINSKAPAFPPAASLCERQVINDHPTSCRSQRSEGGYKAFFGDGHLRDAPQSSSVLIQSALSV